MVGAVAVESFDHVLEVAVPFQSPSSRSHPLTCPQILSDLRSIGAVYTGACRGLPLATLERAKKIRSEKGPQAMFDFLRPRSHSRDGVEGEW